MNKEEISNGFGYTYHSQIFSADFEYHLYVNGEYVGKEMLEGLAIVALNSFLPESDVTLKKVYVGNCHDPIIHLTQIYNRDKHCWEFER